MITTQTKKLDEILTNGISSGTITDIFGFRGTGKTQMALQISLNLLKNELIHTENSYKFSISELESKFTKSGFEINEIWCDSNRYFALILAQKI